MADIFDVLADSTRRDLLSALRESASIRHSGPGAVGAGETGAGDTGPGETGAGEMRVGELVELLGLSQPTVSKHLRVLRDNQLVRVREVGQHRLYRLDAEPLETMRGWLVPFLAPESVAPPAPVADSAAATLEPDSAATALVAAAADQRNEGADDRHAGDRAPVFAAFTRDGLPSPVRRLAVSVQNSAASGEALGRRLARVREGIRSTRGSIALVLARRWI